jgi:hypothetical protein
MSGAIEAIWLSLLQAGRQAENRDSSCFYITNNCHGKCGDAVMGCIDRTLSGTATRPARSHVAKHGRPGSGFGLSWWSVWPTLHDIGTARPVRETRTGYASSRHEKDSAGLSQRISYWMIAAISKQEVCSSNSTFLIEPCTVES